MGSVKAGTLLLLMLGIGGKVYGQAIEPQVMELRVKYYKCVDPAAKPPCVCSSEDEKSESCPNCQVWAEETSSSELNVDLSQRGLYSAGSMPSNYFVRDIAEKVYGTDSPSTPPPTTSLLYKDPVKYGWLELDEASEVTGSVAIWSGGAGLVVEDKNGEKQVLYPSHKLRTLHVENIDELAPPEKVKYIVPIEFVIDKADSGQTSSPPGPA